MADALTPAQKLLGDSAPKAFYAGWPTAMSGVTRLEDIVEAQPRATD